MSSVGTTVGYVKAQANHIKIGDAFLRSLLQTNADLASKWGTDFMRVPEEEVCTEYFFSCVATYVSSVHVIEPGNKNAGQCFDSSTAEIVFNSLLNQTKERLKESSSPKKTVCGHAQRAARTRRAARSAPPITTGLKPRLPADGL